MLDPAPDRDPRRPSRIRVLIWIGVTAVALYFIGSGLLGILGLRG